MIGSIVPLLLLGVGAIIALIALFSGIFKVSNKTAKLIERFGKFKKVAHAGLNMKIPFVDTVRTTINLQVQQHIVAVDTITSDKVSVRISVNVNYQVLEGHEADAFYQLASPETQIESFVFNVVRSHVPSQTLDDVFASQDSIAQAVQTELASDMSQFGYQIIKVLVTEVQPDAKVLAAMNAINENERMKQANEAKGEAAKILVVKDAEAQRDSDRLKGEGIAQQRLAIINGMKESVAEMKEAYPGVGEEVIINMLMATQWMETLQHIGTKDGVSTIFIPAGPDGITNIREQMLQAIAAGHTPAVAGTDQPAAQ